jgi:cytochrome c oxidase cbb3-type subunit III
MQVSEVMTGEPACCISEKALGRVAEMIDTCHGKDGQAKTFKAKFNHARNLTDAKWQAEVSDERIFNSITNGKGKMPAWGKKLSEAQVNALVAYVRKLKR